jgi:hypothetical protein
MTNTKRSNDFSITCPANTIPQIKRTEGERRVHVPFSFCPRAQPAMLSKVPSQGEDLRDCDSSEDILQSIASGMGNQRIVTNSCLVRFLLSGKT